MEANWGLPYAVKTDSKSTVNGISRKGSANIKGVTNKNTNLLQLQLAEVVYAVNCRTQGEDGSVMSRFIGRGTKNNLPNSWDRQMD